MKLEPLNDLPLIREIGELAASKNIEMYVVGGCVRDWALSKPALDMDFLLNSEGSVIVDALIKKYGGTFTRFDKFLTVRVFLDGGRRVDLARFRKEIYPAPAALPVVEPAASVREDLRRRDFTANALALSLSPERFGEVTDPFGGLEDIKRGLVRVLHADSFQDDPTRIFRMARFAGRFDWTLEPDTWELAKQCVKGNVPSLLSRERLRNELVKLLDEKDPGGAFTVLRNLDAMKFFHKAFIWPSGAAGVNGSMNRLAAIAAAMGRDGAPFLESLKLPNKTIAGIKSTAASQFRKHI